MSVCPALPSLTGPAPSLWVLPTLTTGRTPNPVPNHVPYLRPDVSHTCAPGLQELSGEASTRPLREWCPQPRLHPTHKDLSPKLQPWSPGSQAPSA